MVQSKYNFEHKKRQDYLILARHFDRMWIYSDLNYGGGSGGGGGGEGAIISN
jgi:hypothetical protein